MNAAYYLWAQRQIAAEIASDFASLKGLQASGCSRFLRVFESLPDPEKLVTWNHLLKRFHAEGAKAVGAPMTDDDRLAIRRYDEARRTLIATAEPDISRGETASAATFQDTAGRILQHKLQVPSEKCGKKLLRFVSNCRNGVIHTYLDAGSRNYQLCYWHNVLTTSGQSIRERCSILEWFGLSSQTLWDETPETQVESVVNSSADAVTRFIEFADSEWSEHHPLSRRFGERED